MDDFLRAVWGDGFIGMLALGLLALLLWSPALAATGFAWPRTHDFLKRRGAANWLAGGVATATAFAILFAWLPVYVTAIFLTFDLLEALFS